MAKKALGKGLSALIPESNKYLQPLPSAKNILSEKGVLDIPLDKIEHNPYQPRTEFHEDKLKDLVSSIKQKGIIQPLVVRKKGDKYEIVVGERRFLAAKKLKLQTIPAILRKVDDEESLELAIIENIQRSNLNPIEEARAYEQLMSKYSLTQEAVAEKVGKSRESVANMLRLLKLSVEIQKFVLDEKISMGHARALLSLKTSDKQRDFARRIIAQHLSVRDVEKLISLQLVSKSGHIKVKKKSAPSLSPYVQSMSEKIQEKIGTKVTIKESSRQGFGKIEIEYYSHDDLDRIFHLLG